jgi:cobalt-precorrin-5B (C1)-methyltransferase
MRKTLLPVTAAWAGVIEAIMSEAGIEADGKNLRRGWTTGTCAAASAKAACAALLTGKFPDPVEVGLPSGQRPAFALAGEELGENFARASIVKDAGDDPDVTHGALISSTVRRGAPGSGITFKAGPGVGTVTKPGLPLGVGEPSINPVPRQMIAAAIAEVSGSEADFEVEVSVADGERIAEKTLNGRLGILGGISILGTTGIVIPFSCAAWIHSIWRGIDVSRAEGLTHVAGSTGMTSEKAVQLRHDLPEVALLDMGDFVGGMLKYLKTHPVSRVTIAGGVAKMTKLAQGMLDLHSKRGLADLDGLAKVAIDAGASADLADRIRAANTVLHAFEIAAEDGLVLGPAIAALAWQTAAKVLDTPDMALEILIFDRQGNFVAEAPFTPSDHAVPSDPSPFPPLNRRT